MTVSRAFGVVVVGNQCSACSADAVAVAGTPPASMHAMHCAVRSTSTVMLLPLCSTEYSTLLGKYICTC
jgi:hypothetical protein